MVVKLIMLIIYFCCCTDIGLRFKHYWIVLANWYSFLLVIIFFDIENQKKIIFVDIWESF